MPAPQQSQVPTYKETSNIPRPNTAYYEHRERNSGGYALAKLLGVLPDAVNTHQEKEEQGPGPNEQEQLLALAQMGAERDRLKVAKGGTMFGLLRGEETTMDSYDLERGRRDADLFAGELRDAYAKSGLAQNDDPKAFAQFAEQYRNLVFNEKLKGADASYHHGFVTRIGGVFKEMAEAHAGHLDGFLTSQNKRAFQNRLNSKMDLELTVRKERDAFGNFMDNIMGGESGGNYNAFHGNGNNQNIRFTDMTIGEVLDFQKSGSWKRHGAQSSAVGKYQFIHKTLAEVVRASGISLDTKFTPAVQDKLIMYRLMTKRGMKDYLEGKMSAEEFLDSGLAKEFASLKTTGGRGVYDGDGLNKASVSARKTLAALKAFKDAYIQDPGRVTKAEGKDGKPTIVIDAEDQQPDDSLPGMMDTVEQDFGVSQVEARGEVANNLIERMEADPTVADRDDLEDIMADAKLPKRDRQRVREARDRIRKETTQKAQLADNKKSQEILGLADKFIRGGDPEALESIRALDPQVHSRLLDLSTEEANPDDLDNEGFLDAADYDASEFPQRALKAFADGSIDRETYASAMEEHETRALAKPVLKLKGVRKTVNMIRTALPGEELKDTFDSQLSLHIADLIRANDGNRPSVMEVNEAAQTIQQSLLAMYQGDIQQRMARPEYQASPEES